MSRFSNKKLLILGATVNESLIVKRAKELGLYTIVTDSNSDWSKSPAKYLADEAWNISWSDIKSLSKQSIESGVDGVIAGFSEFRVENQIKLCVVLDLPCYITMDQLNVTRDKIEFKELCLKYNVPIVPAYDLEGDIIEFPVIVKPVDRAGSIGISIANSTNEFENAVLAAKRESPTGKIVIEKYMSKCIKFDVYYIIQNGHVALVGSNDTIMCPLEKGYEIMQAAWIFPSKFESEYIDKVDGNVKEMLKSLKIENGYITISGFIDEEHNFYIFETGFRLSGELSYNYIKKRCGLSYLDMMLDYAINGDVGDYNFLKENNSNWMSLVINYYGKDGVVDIKKGIENINEMPNIDFIDYLLSSKMIENNNYLLKKIGMCSIYAQSTDSLLKSLSLVNSTYDVLDGEKNSLLYYRLQQNDLIHYFCNN